MKRLVSIMLSVVMLLSTVVVYADDDKDIEVMFNEEMIEFELQPMIENDIVLVPMRAIFEKLGAKVEWKGETREVVAKNENCVIQLNIGSATMEKISGSTEAQNEEIQLDAPAIIKNDSTFVPLRAVSEAFGYMVNWDGEKRIVSIQTEKEKEDTYTQNFISYLPQNENYIVSPLSLKMAMMMLANGAENETQKQILDTFYVENIDEFNVNAKKFMEDCVKSDDGEINIANSIWFNKDYYNLPKADFSNQFKKTVTDNYDAEIDTVKMNNSIEKVNEWISEKTNGKIKDLLSEENREYLLALVNTVYMKSKWKYEFDEEATQKDIFTDIDGKENEIDFMNQIRHFAYYQDGFTKMVSMPYKNGVSMWVVLGDSSNFENDMKKADTKKIKLSMPKFNAEYFVELKDILSNMGITKAFENLNPDFDSMVQNVPDPIKVETVLQKAFIEVNEKETEAAAATVVIGVDGSAAPPIKEEIIEFSADEPFTYFIVDDSTSEILFAGRYVKCE